MLLGHTCVCAVEIKPYRRRSMLQRQRDGILPRFPIWDDVKTFDGKPWRGLVDIVAGGFPCQDISAANSKGKGIDGERSGLWKEMLRVVREVGPQYVFVENSPMLTVRGLGRVLGGLAEVGYDAVWGVFGASDAIFLAGDPALYHDRYRIFILAVSNANSSRQPQQEGSQRNERGRAINMGEEMPHTERAERWPQGQQWCQTWGERINRLRERQEAASGPGAMGAMVAESADSDSDDQHGRPSLMQVGRIGGAEEAQGGIYGQGNQWATEPAVGRMAHGVAHRNDRLAAVGDGQVPAVVRLAWETLANDLT
jgi:DNA (cytosine-5)-methyltransferase 1